MSQNKVLFYLSFIVKPWADRVKYHFPSEVSEEEGFPQHIIKRLPETRLLEIAITVEWEADQQVKL